MPLNESHCFDYHDHYDCGCGYGHHHHPQPPISCCCHEAPPPRPRYHCPCEHRRPAPPPPPPVCVPDILGNLRRFLNTPVCIEFPTIKLPKLCDCPPPPPCSRPQCRKPQPKPCRKPEPCACMGGFGGHSDCGCGAPKLPSCCGPWEREREERCDPCAMYRCPRERKDFCAAEFPIKCQGGHCIF